jgi:hypothetical protein
MGLYEKRKAHLVDDLRKKLVKLTNKARYIQETLSGVVDLRKKNASQVIDLMNTRKFDMIDGEFKYLVKMPMDSVTEENVAHIMHERDDAQKELEILISTTLEQMWMKELLNLESEYTAYKKKRENIQSGEKSTVSIKKKIKIVKK